MGKKPADRRLGVKLRVLTDEQIEDIHHASLEILERTGIAIEHEGARAHGSVGEPDGRTPRSRG